MRGHHLVDLDHAHGDDAGDEHAGDHPGSMLRRARDRRVDDRGGRRLELEDRRQRRIASLGATTQPRAQSPWTRVGAGAAWRGPCVIHEAVLLRPELAIDRAALEQRAVRGDVHDLALFQHQDLVAFGERRQAVGDDHHGPAARDAQQVGVDQRLALGIERAGGLVEDQDARIGDQRARDREALPLAAGEVGRAFLDVGLVAVRHALDEFFGAGQPGRAHRVVQRQARPAGEDVVADRAAEQEVVLQHDAEALAQVAQVDLAQIGAVDLHIAGVVAVDALQQAGDGRLAGAATARPGRAWCRQGWRS